MDKELIARINELAKKQKAEGLTAAETKEQQELRQRYLKQFRAGFHSHLMNLKVVDPNGKDVTPKKLVRAKKAYRKTEA